MTGSFANGGDSYKASSNISPMRFVELVPGTDYTARQCTASGIPIGVSGLATETFDGVYAATDGRTVRVHGLGETALLELGGTVSAGDFLTPDASGKGVAGSLTVSTHQDYGFVTSQSRFSGEFAQGYVVKFSGVMGVAAS